MSTALKSTPIRQVKSVQELLMNQGARDQLSMVAAKHMNPERMMRVVANAIRTTPKLGQCDPMSFLGAIMQCASLGLEPNTILGHAYLIPFEKSKKVKNERGADVWVKVPEVQVVVGYKGLIDLARRSGHITSLSANIHYSDDDLWEYEEGTESRLRHRPGAQDGEKLHAYAIAKFRDGGHAYVVMPWKAVEKIRDGSQGWQQAVRTNKTADSPWEKHEDEMAKKTAIRALAKYLPLSVEFMDAMSVDEQQADYRSFAMDPTQGVQIDGVAAEEEPEPEQGSPAQIEEQRPVPASTPRQRREPAPRERTVYADPAPRRAAEPEPEAAVVINADQSTASNAEEAEAEINAMRGVYDRIMNDILDGADPAELAETFAAEISRMSAIAPDLHQSIDAEFRAAGWEPAA